MSTVLQVLTVSAAFSALENDAFTISGVKTFSSVLKLPDGAVGAPSWCFSSDPTTGGFRSAASTIDFACGGSSRLSISNTRVLAPTGIMIGSDSQNNEISDNTTGATTTVTLYIGNASITTSSDERIKKNIRNTEVNAVDTLNKLRVVDFEWNDPTDNCYNNRNARVSHGGKWTGMIAQEVVKTVPHIINAPRKEDTLEIDYESENRWFVEYQHLVPMLVKAIQEVATRITALENKQ